MRKYLSRIAATMTTVCKRLTVVIALQMKNLFLWVLVADKIYFMKAQYPPGKQPEIPGPLKFPEVKPPADPEEPLVVPEEDPEIIPDEDPFETPPPYEIPEPGEGP